MTAQVQSIFLLLVVYQIKHFLADFPLQNDYMLQKDHSDWSFFVPLATHCLVHAGFTLAVCLYYRPGLWWLALLDFVVHFFMDRIKAGPKYLGRFNNKDRAPFWNCFGIDQMVHHLTYLYIVWVLVA